MTFKKENSMICQIINFLLDGKVEVEKLKKKISFEYFVELQETWLSGFCDAKCKTQWSYEWLFLKILMIVIVMYFI